MVNYIQVIMMKKLKKLMEAVEANDWGYIASPTGYYTLISPRNEKYEPHKIVTRFSNGEPDKYAEIVADIGRGRGERGYPVAYGTALKAILNTHHPLRASRFFAHADVTGKNIRQLCEPHDLPASLIRIPAMKGYFKFFDADRASLKILSMLPSEVWGTEAWLQATEEEWE